MCLAWIEGDKRQINEQKASKKNQSSCQRTRKSEHPRHAPARAGVAVWAGRTAPRSGAMFEGLVERVLKESFGDLFEDFGDLRIAVWSGDVHLQNLQIKRSALDRIQAAWGVPWPIVVVSGTVRSLRVQVPWKSLSTSRVRILVDGIRVVCRFAQPLSDFSGPVLSSAGSLERLRLKAKRQSLRQAELVWLLRGDAGLAAARARGVDGVSVSATTSIKDRLLATVAANLDVTVRDVRIRFEDLHTVPSHPYSAGLVLDEVRVFTVAGQTQTEPVFIDPHSERATATRHRLVQIRGLGLFWNSDDGSMDIGGASATKLNQKKHPKAPQGARGAEPRPGASSAPRLRYILHPFDCTARVANNASGFQIQKPQTDVTATVTAAHLSIDNAQARDIRTLTRALRIVVLRAALARARERRPRARPVGRRASRAWWRYACASVMAVSRPRAHSQPLVTPLARIAESKFAQRLRIHRDYVPLYKRKQALEHPKARASTRKLTAIEQKKLQALEDYADVNDILRYRIEAAYALELEVQNRYLETKLGKSGSVFGAWRFPGRTTAKPTWTLTAAQKRGLFAAVDYDKLLESLLPSSFVNDRVSFMFCL